jgi:Ca-activated chloride channel family protein
MAIHAELAPSPFTAGKLLLRVGMKAREVDAADRKDAVLVFVIDTSGSMAQDGRLELVKKALHLLVDELDVGDRVGIVAFSTHARKVLHPCGLEDRDAILAAIDSLHPENTTNAQEGLELGYEMARKAFRKGAINRVILCSDGVANEGVTTAAGILAGVERAAKDGITLSTVGVGMGNYNDVLLEQLADKGHGNYAYVDRLAEARRIFSRNLTQTLQVVARDAKVQVDFNSDIVRSWRLVGYENRDVANKDFRNDKVGGGDVGAGHAVTALYELRLNAGKDGRLARIYVRYQPPDGGWAREVERNVTAADLVRRFSDTSDSFKLAVATAEFAEILRDSPWARRTALADVLAVAKECEANRASKNVHELVGLIEETRRLKADNRDSRDYSDEE